jgi:hypothetical protein
MDTRHQHHWTSTISVFVDGQEIIPAELGKRMIKKWERFFTDKGI